jgi:hypothetical protein
MRLVPLMIVMTVAVCSSAGEVKADWVVSYLKGDATAATPGQPTTVLTPGTLVPDTVTVETGARGRVMLTRGTSVLVVGPRSSLTVQLDAFGGTVTVLQRVGTINFAVEKRKVRYFNVETPFLTAMVKGTRFAVTVGKDRSEVSVSQGIVGVMALPSGATADLPAGQNAKTGGAALVLSGAGSKQVSIGRPRLPVVQPMAAEAVAARVRAVVTGVKRSALVPAARDSASADRASPDAAPGPGTTALGAAGSIGTPGGAVSGVASGIGTAKNTGSLIGSSGSGLSASVSIGGPGSSVSAGTGGLGVNVGLGGGSLNLGIGGLH